MRVFIQLFFSLVFLFKSQVYKSHFLKLELINQSKNLVNSAIFQIQESSRLGKIQSKTSEILINGIKCSLESGELTLKLEKTNLIKIVVRHSAIQAVDEKIYYFSFANMQLRVHLKRQLHTSWLIVLTVCGLAILVCFLYVKNIERSSISDTSQAKHDVVNFPLNICGDLTVGGKNTWYPVYVPYSKPNLDKIRAKFCCDADYHPRNNAIQVASFYDKRRASEFAQLLKKRGFKHARVGYGTLTITRSSSSPRMQCYKSR
jgi:hypothetical protein